MEIRISALIIIIVWSLLLLFASYNFGYASGKITVVSIHGEGFGNNGLHFVSFADCPNQQNKYFNGGSHLNFTVDFSNTAKSKKGIGTWIIEYKSGDLSDFGSFFQRGFFVNGNTNGSHYNLTGLKTTDTVCKGSPARIILTGVCGENAPLNFEFADGEKTGSTVPQKGGNVYHLFGSVVRCTVANSSQ